MKKLSTHQQLKKISSHFSHVSNMKFMKQLECKFTKDMGSDVFDTLPSTKNEYDQRCPVM